MPKYEYRSDFEVLGGRHNPKLPTLGTSSLQEAIDYIEDAKGGTLVTSVEVAPHGGRPVTIVPLLEYQDVSGKSEAEVFELLDRDIDGRLQLLSALRDKSNRTDLTGPFSSLPPSYGA